MSAAHDTPVPPDAARDVERLLRGVLSREESDRVRSHVRGCEACAALYDRAASAERSIAGPGASEERVLAWLEVGGGGAPARAAAKAPRGRLVAAGGFAVLAIAFAIRAWMTPPVDPYGVRGAHDPQSVGIRVFELTGETREIADGAEVARRDHLGVAYSNVSGFEYVTWVVAGGGTASVLDEISGPIKSGVTDEPLDAEVAIDDRFPAGPVRIVAIFSSEPPSRAALLDEAARADASPIRFPGQELAAQRVRTLQVRGESP